MRIKFQGCNPGSVLNFHAEQPYFYAAGACFYAEQPYFYGTCASFRGKASHFYAEARFLRRTYVFLRRRGGPYGLPYLLDVDM